MVGPGGIVMLASYELNIPPRDPQWVPFASRELRYSTTSRRWTAPLPYNPQDSFPPIPKPKEGVIFLHFRRPHAATAQSEKGGASDESNSERRMRAAALLSLSLPLALLAPAARGFSLPGVQMTTYKKGERMPMFVNSMTSSETLLPIDYYKLPLCQVRVRVDS